MRSNRNPYYLYKNKADVHIQQLLADAPLLTDAQIDARTAKPDLRKAMRFVRDLGDQTRSLQTAEIVAEHMASKHAHTHECVSYDLWHYSGATISLKTKTKSELLIQDAIFLLDQDQIWIQHNWCPLPTDQTSFWNSCVKLGNCTHAQYNQELQRYLARKYPGA